MEVTQQTLIPSLSDFLKREGSALLFSQWRISLLRERPNNRQNVGYFPSRSFGTQVEAQI